MIEFILPGIMLLMGILFLLFPGPIGVAFCRMGKANWRAMTFGKTDMARFYPEEKAPTIFRVLGVAWILLSIPWLYMAFASLSGPGALAAIRQSRTYLSEHYGSSGSSKLSATPVSSGASDYVVTYQYGGHAGTLNASWQKDHYVLSEGGK